MKKLSMLLIALLLLLVPAFAEETEETEQTEEIVFLPGQLIEEDFIFLFNEAEYALGCEAAELIAAIEAHYEMPMDVLEAPSCLFDGMDREYSNEDLVFATYPIGEDGADMLETVMVFSPEYPSARGICVGMTRAEVEAAYGDNYYFDYNQMFYFLNVEENSPMIVFTLEEDVVLEYYLFLNTGV